MNNYEAIFARKSVRKYHMRELSGQLMEQVERCCQDTTTTLFGDMEVEYRIFKYNDHVIRTLSPFIVKAPYYLALYIKPQPKAGMNAG